MRLKSPARIVLRVVVTEKSHLRRPGNIFEQLTARAATSAIPPFLSESRSACSSWSDECRQSSGGSTLTCSDPYSHTHLPGIGAITDLDVVLAERIGQSSIEALPGLRDRIVVHLASSVAAAGLKPSVRSAPAHGEGLEKTAGCYHLGRHWPAMSVSKPRSPQSSARGGPLLSSRNPPARGACFVAGGEAQARPSGHHHPSSRALPRLVLWSLGLHLLEARPVCGNWIQLESRLEYGPAFLPCRPCGLSRDWFCCNCRAVVAATADRWRAWPSCRWPVSTCRRGKKGNDEAPGTLPGRWGDSSGRRGLGPVVMQERPAAIPGELRLCRRLARPPGETAAGGACWKALRKRRRRAFLLLWGPLTWPGGTGSGRGGLPQRLRVGSTAIPCASDREGSGGRSGSAGTPAAC